MNIRPYENRFLDETMTMIRQCILTVNTQDYSDSQVQAWANLDPKRFYTRDDNHAFLMFSDDDQIIGFADIDDGGYLDNLFVNKDWQHKGVAISLLDKLESVVSVNALSTYASITARAFFEKRGYVVVRENKVALRGEVFVNYYMEKKL